MDFQIKTELNKTRYFSDVYKKIPSLFDYIQFQIMWRFIA
jgi:hypothetical protein